jgi:uncharacterized protein YebE (UPF0316 family)
MEQFDWFSWVVLPVLIFLARICDVTLGTLRIIFVARGYRRVAPLIGFFESLIWLTAVSQIIRNISNPMSYLAFAGGYATGSFLGLYVESKLAVGLQCVRIITQEDASDLIDTLRAGNFGVTSVSAMGLSGNVRLILSIVKRADVGILVKLIQNTHPKAFITVEDVRSVTEGYIQQHRRTWLHFFKK